MSEANRSIFQRYSIFVFRTFLSFIFLAAGIKHVLATAQVANRLSGVEVGKFLAGYMPLEPLIFIAGIGLLAGGIALLLGFQTRKAALMLISLIIPITLVVQTQGMHTIGPFFKNIGLLGGLIYFYANGSCTYSLDQKIQLQKVRFKS